MMIVPPYPDGYAGGIDKVRTETGMFYTSYNLVKMYRYAMKQFSSYAYGLDRLGSGDHGRGAPLLFGKQPTGCAGG